MVNLITYIVHVHVRDVKIYVFGVIRKSVVENHDLFNFNRFMESLNSLLSGQLPYPVSKRILTHKECEFISREMHHLEL